MNTVIVKKLLPKKPSSFRKLSAKSYQLKAILSAFRNLKPKTYHLPPSRGFTLIEMLVSISVFMVVMTVASGSLASIIDANGKAQTLKSAINNLNFSIESMAKNIRVGTDYSVSGCSPANTCISFDSYKDLNGDGNMNNDAVIYKYREDDSVNHTGLIERCSTTDLAACTINNGIFTRLTAPEVKITNMKFYISAPLGNAKPRVLITASGKAGSKAKIETNFNIQTTVSQRAF